MIGYDVFYSSTVIFLHSGGLKLNSPNQTISYIADNKWLTKIIFRQHPELKDYSIKVYHDVRTN